MIQDGWTLVEEATGTPAKVDGTYLDFRGAPLKLLAGYPPKHEASTGRIDTDKGTFYPSVCNLKWVRYP